MMKPLCTIFLLMALLFSARATTINIGCTYPEITNALLTTAQEGDTVLLGAGDCIISNSIFVQRHISFTIAGSGSNLTTLRSTGSPLGCAIWIQSNSTNTFSIHDLNIVGSAADGGATLICGHNNFDSPGYYHVNNIQMTNVVTRGISVGYGKSYSSRGLVDHVYMKAGLLQSPQYMDFQGASYGSWTNSNPIGTTNAFYVEDCTFDNGTNYGNGFFDAYTGAQFVFRHNLCIGYSAAGSHGYDSSDISPRTWEIYNNIFTNPPGSQVSASIISMRGGTGLIFSNTTYSASGACISLALYRACPSDHIYDTGPQYYCGGNLYIVEGVPGYPYVIDFSSNCPTAGQGLVLTNNPVQGQLLTIGFTHYFFVTNLSAATFDMANVSGFGGGAVLIGSDSAHTITNLVKAINVDPTGYGSAYTNWNGVAFPIGHEFVARSNTTSRIYCWNALDGTNAFGYPGNQQPGVLNSYPLTDTNFVNNQTVFPIYQWSNTFNGSLVTLSSAFTDSCGNYVTNLFKIGRDYSNAMPSALVYTPLPYPHPLLTGNGGGGGGQALPAGSGSISFSGGPDGAITIGRGVGF